LIKVATIPDRQQPKPQVDAGRALSVCLHVTQRSPIELANKLGVSRQQLHRMKESKKIRKDRLESIAEYFDMSVDEFLNIPSEVISFSLERSFHMSLSYLSAEKNMSEDDLNDVVNKMADLLLEIKKIEGGDA